MQPPTAGGCLACPGLLAHDPAERGRQHTDLGRRTPGGRACPAWSHHAGRDVLPPPRLSREKGNTCHVTSRILVVARTPYIPPQNLDRKPCDHPDVRRKRSCSSSPPPGPLRPSSRPPILGVSPEGLRRLAAPCHGAAAVTSSWGPSHVRTLRATRRMARARGIFARGAVTGPEGACDACPGPWLPTKSDHATLAH